MAAGWLRQTPACCLRLKRTPELSGLYRKAKHMAETKIQSLKHRRKIARLSIFYRFDLIATSPLLN